MEAIDKLAGKGGRSKFIKEAAEKKIAGVPATSPICIAEVQAGVKPEEEERTNSFLDSLRIYVLDQKITFPWL